MVAVPLTLKIALKVPAALAAPLIRPTDMAAMDRLSTSTLAKE